MAYKQQPGRAKSQEFGNVVNRGLCGPGDECDAFSKKKKEKRGRGKRRNSQKQATDVFTRSTLSNTSIVEGPPHSKSEGERKRQWGPTTPTTVIYDKETKSSSTAPVIVGPTSTLTSATKYKKTKKGLKQKSSYTHSSIGDKESLVTSKRRGATKQFIKETGATTGDKSKAKKDRTTKVVSEKKFERKLGKAKGKVSKGASYRGEQLKEREQKKVY
jgi:hypothetical protein